MLGWVTDGGLETDLLFHRGLDLPDFAAFPLLDQPATTEMLTGYYRQYVAVAAAAGAGCVLETPTWRANLDWGARLGYDAAALDRTNRAAVDLVRRAAGGEVPVRISGVVGPRGDGYVAAGHRPEEAAVYHRPQIASLAAGGVEVVHAMTLSEVGEAVGVEALGRRQLMEELDEGDLQLLVSSTADLLTRLPSVTTLGGCCGTDARHVAALWGVEPAVPA